MNISIKRLYHPVYNIETGAILTTLVPFPTTPAQKQYLESILIHFAFHNLYRGQGLNLFNDIHTDTPSIIAIRRINNIPDQIITL